MLLPGTQLDGGHLLMSWETVEIQITVTLPFHQYEHEQNLVPFLFILSTTEQLVSLNRKLWILATESLRSCSLYSLKKSLSNRTVTASLWTFSPSSVLCVSHIDMSEHCQSLFKRALLSREQRKECLISCSAHYSYMNKAERYTFITHWLHKGPIFFCEFKLIVQR